MTKIDKKEFKDCLRTIEKNVTFYTDSTLVIASVLLYSVNKVCKVCKKNKLDQKGK